MTVLDKPIVVYSTQIRETFDGVFPFKLKLRPGGKADTLTGELIESRDWCKERFGTSGIRALEWDHIKNGPMEFEIDPAREWASIGRDFYFKSEYAAFEFRLRWT